MTRIVIVGDVGGCADELRRVVLPATEDPDAIVVQVGDLVDRGPDSAGVLALVAERLTAAPRRWIQLIGNHEGQYLGGERFWPEPLGDDDADLLRRWWLTDRMRVACAVRTADGEEFLVTHAGITVDAWRELGEPVTATTAADLLNTRPEPLLWHDRGPLWAEAAPHLYRSWLDGPVAPPFGQVHGHSTIVSYTRRAWTCPELIRARSTVDWDARHTTTRVSGVRFVAVDPKHGRTGAPAWSPLVLEDATLLA
ncbi:hypothetical protein GCM10009557_41870 [Virgisporangium ochraceum]|uniref:Calcineurin-like phosphoesterase domain-containing protein n=1 Tax=Virgisporangium ochraceum TaxID=65505 RepID=A0A8J4EEI4_9ACTN|nr:metallophosphoesterase [Virgisporangium ochraceum]GIJ71799.1 hypothetical protein Voc01_067160 [Virgisporangium ochraceum]